MHEGRPLPLSPPAVSSQAAWRHHVWLALLVVAISAFSFVAACATPFAAFAAVAALTLSRGDALRITRGALARRPDRRLCDSRLSAHVGELCLGRGDRGRGAPGDLDRSMDGDSPARGGAADPGIVGLAGGVRGLRGRAPRGRRFGARGHGELHARDRDADPGRQCRGIRRALWPPPGRGHDRPQRLARPDHRVGRQVTGNPPPPIRTSSPS